MTHGARPGFLATLGLLVALPAVAQQAPRPERLYISPLSAGRGPRVLGLAGAFVSVAERAEGLTSNVAALAQRHPLLYGSVDFDGTVSWLGTLGNPGARDQDNDGRADKAVDTNQKLASLMLQIRRFGIGVYYRANVQKFCSVEACPAGDYLEVDLGTAGVAAAFSLFDDDLILGAGLYSAQSAFLYHGEGWNYLGNTFEADLLWRPNGRPFRVGAVFRPEVEGTYQAAPMQSLYVLGRPIYGAVVSPGILSVGASIRIGDGARNYNRLSPKAREVMLDRVGPAATPAEVPFDAAEGQLLVSMQVDLVFPVRNAISSATFTSLDPVAPEFIGAGTYVVPRLGLEHDTLPGRLRTRVGTWFEPSPFAGHPQRAHVAGGLDFRIGHFLIDWSVYGAVDVTERYYFYNLGVSAWPGPTPYKKPKQVVRAEEEEAQRQAEEENRKAEEEQRLREERQEREKESPRQAPVPAPGDAPGSI